MTLPEFADGLHQTLSTLHHVSLISHRNPDGDAFGSLESMRWLLLANYPDLTVSVIVPTTPEDTHISWILRETVQTIPRETELILLLDAALLTRTDLSVDTFDSHTVMSIDHHEFFPENTPGYRDSDSPSTTILLTEIAEYLGWNIDPQTATALLLGIYTDTGGFIHRNTNERALSTAARLFALGADQSQIAQKVFGNYSLAYLHSLAQGLQDIVVVDRVAILTLPEHTEPALKTHIVGYLSGLADVDIACVLRPEWDEIKGSFRTRYDHIDVNQLAQKFGGGGHKKAAGFRWPGGLMDGKILWNQKEYTKEEFIVQLIHQTIV